MTWLPELADALQAGEANYDALLSMVGTATPEARSAAYSEEAVHTAIGASDLGGGEKLALSTALAEGSLAWAPMESSPSGSDFMDFFGRQDGEGAPPPLQEMNCWELILYSAWRCGQVSTAWVVERYELLGEKAIGVPSWEELGYSPGLPEVDSAAGGNPRPGDMVFFVPVHPDLASVGPQHVVLALGGGTAMSLWNSPERGQPASRLVLREYGAEYRLQYGAPSWL